MGQIDITIVRSLHIIFGVLWVGMAFTMAAIFIPFTRNTKNRELMMRWFAESNFNKIMPINAIVTTLAGLYITGRLYALNGGGWLSNTGMIVLNTGMIFGLLAFGHGIALGVLSAKYVRASRAALADGPTQGAEGLDIDDLHGRMIRSGNISLVLTFIALITMSAARYL